MLSDAQMTRISAWGNSHGVRLPRDVLEEAGIPPNADVTIRAESGRILIEPVKRKPTLDELLARIEPGAATREVDFGPPIGREVL
ncbi:MAG: hypothetical protein AMXMBFR42_03830 [Burkholderiales bacterium]